MSDQLRRDVNGSEVLASRDATKRTHVKVGLEVDPKVKSATKSTRSNSQISKSSSNDGSLVVPKWEPENWTDVLDNIRAEHSKPPGFGMNPCNLCIDGYVSPTVLRYQALVSQVLKKSSEDNSADSAMQRLRKHGLTVPNIVKTDEKLILKLIYPLISWKSKANHVKKLTQILHEEHDGDLPVSLEQLMKLPGVEPKMALICMNFSRECSDLSQNGALVANRLGWVREATKTVPDTTEALESWLPPDLRDEVYHLLDEYSRLTCTTSRPACRKCPNKLVCPFYADQLTLNPC